MAELHFGSDSVNHCYRCHSLNLQSGFICSIEKSGAYFPIFYGNKLHEKEAKTTVSFNFTLNSNFFPPHTKIELQPLSSFTDVH